MHALSSPVCVSNGSVDVVCVLFSPCYARPPHRRSAYPISTILPIIFTINCTISVILNVLCVAVARGWCPGTLDETCRGKIRVGGVRAGLLGVGVGVSTGERQRPTTEHTRETDERIRTHETKHIIGKPSTAPSSPSSSSSPP